MRKIVVALLTVLTSVPSIAAVSGKQYRIHTDIPSVQSMSWLADEGCLFTLRSRNSGMSRMLGKGPHAGATLLRVDAVGKPVWDVAFPGTDEALAAGQRRDGTFIVAGTSYRGKESFPWIAALDADGALLWSRQLLGLKLTARTAYVLPDGGLLIAGFKEADAFVLRLSAAGKIVWQKTLAITGYESIEAIQPTSDGGFILAGYESEAAWLLRMSAKGDVLWNRFIGGARSFAYAVTQTRDGGFAIAGARSGAQRGITRIFVAKTRKDGSAEWQRVTPAEYSDTACSIVETPDGNLVVGALRAAAEGDASVLVAELSKGGDVIRQRLLFPNEIDRYFIEDAWPSILTLDKKHGLLAAAGIFSDLSLRVVAFNAAGETDSFCAIEDAALEWEPLQSSAQPVPVTVSNAEIEVDDLVLTVERRPAEAENLCAGEATKRPAPPPAPPKAPTPELLLRADALAKEVREFEKEARQLFEKRQFAQLDARADQLRSSGAEFRPGLAKLSVLYNAVTAPGPADTDADRESWRRLIAEWRKGNPRSPAAPIVHADRLLNEAWRARGGHFSSTITDAAYDQFAKLMNEANVVLRESAHLSFVDPEYWTVLIGVQQGHSALSILEENGPCFAYPALHLAAGNFELPQWGGSHESYAHLIGLVDKQLRGVHRDLVVARLAYQYVTVARDEDTSEEGLRGRGMPWPEVREAFKRWTTAVPHDLVARHQFAYLAWLLGDFATVSEVLTAPEMRWSVYAEQVWGDKRDKFDLLRPDSN